MSIGRGNQRREEIGQSTSSPWGRGCGAGAKAGQHLLVPGDHAAAEILTNQEHDALAAYEAVIEAGQKIFWQVGCALLEIRDRRLYRQTHGSFEAYVAGRWGWSRQHAYRVMDASAVAKNLSPMGAFRFYQEPYGLPFRFWVRDTALGRSVVDRVRRGELRAVSVAFKAREVRLDLTGYIHDVMAADLVELSLVPQSKAAWYGTWVRVEQ